MGAQLIKSAPRCIPRMPIYYEAFSARNFNTSPLTIDGWLGDSYDYTVMCQFADASGDSILDVTCNTDTTSNYRNYEIKGLSSTASAAVGDSNTAVELQNVIGTANPGLLILSITGDSSDERYFDILYSGDGAILKQSSYWKDTINELTQIVLTGASSVTCDASIAVFATPKETSSENWTLIEENTWSLSSSDQTFSNLDGDQAIKYKLDLEEDTGTLWVRINNDSGTNYTRQMLYNQNGVDTSVNSSLNRLSIEGSTSTILINAETGQERLCLSSSSNKGAARDQAEQATWYSNTATNITSLVLTNLSSSTGTAKLYKLKNPNTVADHFNLPFKMLRETAVSGDFSAGDTLTFDCDKALMIKIEGLFSTVGNDLRLQLDGDTGSNYTEQYVKGVSSTPSAANTTTTFELLCDASASKVAHFEYYLYPQSGEYRPSLLRVGHGEDSIEYKAHWWLNSADEINTIKVFASSTTTCTGTLKYSAIYAPKSYDEVSMTDFDGSNDDISVNDSASLDITGDLTLGAWVNLDVTGSSRSVIAKWSGSPTVRAYWLYINASNKVTLELSSDGTTTTVSLSGSTSLAAGELYHVAARYDGSTVKVYLNGVEDGSTAYSSGISSTSEEVRIGSVNSGTAVFMNGSMLMPMIFNSAIDATEIDESLYNNGRPRAYDTLKTSITDDCVLAIEMSSDDTSLNDLSGNSNNGTGNGGITIGASSKTANLQTV